MKVGRSINFVMVMALLVTSFAFSQPAVAASTEKKIDLVPVRLDEDRAEGEIVVVYADSSEKSLPALVSQAFETASENDGVVTRLTLDGSMVLKVDEDDLVETLEELNNDPNILYAEPNYTFSLPEPASTGDGYVLNSEYVLRTVEPSAATNYKSTVAVPIVQLQAMKTKKGSTIQATYPNDPYLFQNGGWTAVRADFVWNNNIASANVCVVDTGVHRVHKDFVYKTPSGTTAYRIINGYDFVWGDTNPDDDNGHGTHVAGVIAAVRNNKIGISGVSTGNVVAVKALDAQGVGTIFDIAAAIQYCANRSDVRVINLSLGGPTHNQTLKDAVAYAVNKNKLVVAAAGNNGSSSMKYPAAYSVDFPNRVIAVAASGKFVDNAIQYQCAAPYTNYGSWVTVVAPGTSIYSTTPWDKSFYLNFHGGINTRFDYMSGTSMATPFVAGAAARYWGYKPLETNTSVGEALQTYGSPVSSNGGCWDASMNGKSMVNLAKLLDRGAIFAGAYDANDGTPLINATISAYQSGTKRGSALLAPVIIPAPPDDLDPTRIYIYPVSSTDIINLPVNGGSYTARVNKAGYTAGDQAAYRHEANVTLIAGDWITLGDAAVPPRSADFDIVLLWKVRQADGNVEAKPLPLYGFDLDLNVWLPNTPNPLDSNQPGKFIVGLQSTEYGATGDPYGASTGFPYARIKREGGYTDNTLVETITIRNRFQAHSPVAKNIALPYYPHSYSVYVTDYGQTIDDDGDGCGDNYGRNHTSTPAPCEGTPGIPLMGAYLRPYVYVWKDGAIRSFTTNSNNESLWAEGGACNNHWWKALVIHSGASGAPSYNEPEPAVCGNGEAPDWFPYLFSSAGGRISTNDDGK